MVTAAMILLAMIGVMLFASSPMLSVLCFGAAWWVGTFHTVNDESRFMGWLFVLAILGIVASILN